MDIKELEATKSGFRCRKCKITVLGWCKHLLCRSCHMARNLNLCY